MHEDVSAVASRDYGEYTAAGMRGLAKEEIRGAAPPLHGYQPLQALEVERRVAIHSKVFIVNENIDALRWIRTREGRWDAFYR